jgi:GH25 family lysozyme M1 (1,4-beta-N-acetylmuramidase)
MQRPARRHRFAGLGLAGLIALIFALVAPSIVAAATTSYVANCNVNLRATPTLGGTVEAVIDTGAVVVATGTVAGDSWSATCGTDVSGSSWLVITSVGGTSTSSLYGVPQVYAASGLFHVQAPAAWLEGVDVSRWQGTIDFGKVAAAGKSFVVAKATEGIGFTDPNWATYLANATKAGLKVTGYHFARPDGNPTKPVQEADWFVSQLGLTNGMIVPALDLEKSGMSVASLQAWVGAWLGEVYLKTGVRPMIYTSPSFWHTYMGNTTQFADAGYKVLWVAHWFVTQPSVPANNWSNHGWTFWQYDDCGSVPGIGGCVDMDRYNGLDMTPVIVGADFGLGAGPAKQSVEQGASTRYTVSITRSWFTLPVGLAVNGLPSGVKATLDSTSVVGSSVGMSIDVSGGSGAPQVGTYPFVITGTANGVTHSTTATLVVTDAAPPTVSVPKSTLFSKTTLWTTGAPVKTTWSASDASGVAQDQLQRQDNGAGWAAVTLSGATATSITQTLVPGTTYGYQASATDTVGNTTPWVSGAAFTPVVWQQAWSGTTYGGTWHWSTTSSASGGTTKYAYGSGASVRYAFTGSSIAWVAPTGPTRGSADVYIDGAFKGTVSTYASTYHARQIVFAYNWSTNGAHSIKIVLRGTSGHPRVDVDAFVQLVQG